MAVDGPKSLTDSESQPMTLQNRSQSPLLKCREYGVRITVDGCSFFLICQTYYSLDGFVTGQEWTSIGFARQFSIDKHPHEDRPWDLQNFCLLVEVKLQAFVIDGLKGHRLIEGNVVSEFDDTHAVRFLS